MLLQALCIISQQLANSNSSYSPETSNFGQNLCFFCPMWPRNLMDDIEKTIGLFFYDTSSFVYDVVAIGPFKLELQSGNTQLGSKSVIFVQCDLEIWRMTLKNNRAPHLCCFKLCISFRSHRRIQTWATVRKRLIRVDFFTSVAWPLTSDLDLLHGHLFCQW